MRNDYPSYLYYFGFNRLFSYTIKAKVNLFNSVDPEILSKAVNSYAKRHTWLLKMVIYTDHEYKLVDNDLPIIVNGYTDKIIKLNAKESNYHLLYVQYKDRTVYFNISHAIIGGMAFSKLILGIIDDYADLIEGKSLQNKNDVLENEDLAPKLEDFKGFEPLMNPSIKEKFFIPTKDNLSNLFFGNSVSAWYEFKIEDLMKVAKSVEASPAVLFSALMYLAVIKLYPKNKKIIKGITMHNILLSFPKYINYHGQAISHIHHYLPTKLKDYSLDKLCTIIRGTILAQSDVSMDGDLLKRALQAIEQTDQEKKYIKKAFNATFNNPMTGIKNNRFTYAVSYNGKNVNERLSKYIDSYFFFVDGLLLVEITSLNDKLFLSLQINKNGQKYIEAFESIMNKYEIKYSYLGKEKRILPKMARCPHKIN